MPTIEVPCDDCGNPVQLEIGQGNLALCQRCGAKRIADMCERADQGQPDEQGGGPEEIREEDLGGTYLSQAAQSLIACRDPAAVFPPQRPAPDSGSVQRDYMFYAYPTRLALARNGVLWAAFAAEAYINVYLKRLNPKVFDEEIEPKRWRTLDKYIEGTARVREGKPLFKRGERPVQDLKKLIGLRNRLAHPKLTPIPIRRTGFFPDETGYEDFNPAGVARFLVAVATAAEALAEDAGGSIELDKTAKFIAAEQEAVLSFGEEAMFLPPHPDSQRPPPEVLRIPITRTAYFRYVVPTVREYRDGELHETLDLNAKYEYDFGNP